MKFKCPKKIDVLMEAAKDMREWHVIFAVLPHRTKEDICVWLEKVERRYPEAWVGTYYKKLYYETPVYRLIGSSDEQS